MSHGRSGSVSAPSGSPSGRFARVLPLEPVRAVQLVVGLTILIDATLYFAILPLLPTYAVRFHLSKFGAGIVLAAYPLMTLFTSVPAGVLTPTLGARRLTILSGIAFTAATVAFALAPNAFILAVARALQGLASGVAWTSGLAWLTATAGPERRGRAVARAMSFLSLGAVTGPSIGAVAGATSAVAPFLVIAVISAIITMAAVLCPDALPTSTDPGMLVGALRTVSAPLVLAATILGAVDGGGAGAVELLVPLHLGRLGYGAAVIGTCLTISAVCGALVGYRLGHFIDRFGALRLGLIGGFGYGLFVLLFAVPLAGPVLFVLLFLSGPFTLLLLTVMVPLAAEGADRAGVSHGIANGLTGTSWSMGVMAASAGAGGLAQAFSDSVAFIVSAIVIALLMGMVIVLTRR